MNQIHTAMETEISEGIFLSVITKEQWLKRTEALQGDDLRHFVERCNRYPETDIIIKHVLGITSKKFLKLCIELNPEFNKKEDFYVIRYAPGV